MVAFSTLPRPLLWDQLPRPSLHLLLHPPLHKESPFLVDFLPSLVLELPSSSKSSSTATFFSPKDFHYSILFIAKFVRNIIYPRSIKSYHSSKQITRYIFQTSCLSVLLLVSGWLGGSHFSYINSARGPINVTLGKGKSSYVWSILKPHPYQCNAGKSEARLCIISPTNRKYPWRR